MDELRDDTSPVTETALLSVLCSIGASAFVPLAPAKSPVGCPASSPGRR
jgi:hypothetical protein